MHIKEKLIALDLDGTLLHDDKTISDYTIKILKECKCRNVKLAIVTARPLRAAYSYSEKVDADYLICHNGAVIYNGKAFTYSSIKKPDIEKIIQILKTYAAGSKIAIESDDKMIANFPTEETWKENDYERSEFKDILVDHADKILFFLDDVGLEKGEIQKRIPEECYLMVIDKNLGMILSKEATKYKAVKKVLEKEGISIEDTYFFGDDDNDTELLKKAGYGVAVDNAHPDVKKAARYLCRSNNEDGVALWLSREMGL